MYTSINFTTKKAFKDAIARGDRVTLYDHASSHAPSLNGVEYVEGPHFPMPHTWYATATTKDGIVTKVI